jgi:6-pyruvoyl-tetrahydropterin synthase
VRLESGELGLDAVHRIPRQNAGEIDDARGERRHGHEYLGERKTCREAEERRDRDAS